MTVRDTSIDAYCGAKISAGQRRVLDFLAKYPNRDWTRNELATMSGIAINIITARVHELLAAGHLQERDRRACKFSGKQAHPVRLTPAQQPLAMDQAA